MRFVWHAAELLLNNSYIAIARLGQLHIKYYYKYNILLAIVVRGGGGGGGGVVSLYTVVIQGLHSVDQDPVVQGALQRPNKRLVLSKQLVAYVIRWLPLKCQHLQVGAILLQRRKMVAGTHLWAWGLDFRWSALGEAGGDALMLSFGSGNRARAQSVSWQWVYPLATFALTGGFVHPYEVRAGRHWVNGPPSSPRKCCKTRQGYTQRIPSLPPLKTAK